MADALGILDFLEILDYPGLPEILDILDKTIELAAAGCVETRKTTGFRAQPTNPVGRVYGC